MSGWEFRGGDTSVTVAEPDQTAAEAIARRHLSGEPGSEPKRACDEVFNIYGIKRGGVLIRRAPCSGRSATVSGFAYGRRWTIS
jgi:hypothetical protein